MVNAGQSAARSQTRYNAVRIMKHWENVSDYRTGVICSHVRIYVCTAKCSAGRLNLAELPPIRLFLMTCPNNPTGKLLHRHSICSPLLNGAAFGTWQSYRSSNMSEKSATSSRTPFSAYMLHGRLLWGAFPTGSSPTARTVDPQFRVEFWKFVGGNSVQIPYNLA